MSIVRVGLSDKNFSAGYDAIFRRGKGKPKAAAKKPAKTKSKVKARKPKKARKK